jgi:hypothetical protein
MYSLQVTCTKVIFGISHAVGKEKRMALILLWNGFVSALKMIFFLNKQINNKSEDMISETVLVCVDQGM